MIDSDAKELIQALVTTKISSGKTTDALLGGANGLTMLLHGGPGTGKSFTGESIAEFAEKPLLRATLGEMMHSDTLQVESYLKTVFSLAALWDCVVLLESADMLLERNSSSDLSKAALVSTLLHVWECHQGILILTTSKSDIVFSESFKSRIQFSLHYGPLTLTQRHKIWRNSLRKLKHADGKRVEYDDILDHLDDLARPEMNGREIQHTIATAQHLARHRRKKMCYSHLKHVLDVSGRFDKHLQDIRGADKA